MSYGVRETWVPTLSPPFASCKTLDKISEGLNVINYLKHQAQYGNTIIIIKADQTKLRLRSTIYMTMRRKIWAWVQNFHLLNESKTDLQRENFKGNYETYKFSLVTKILYMHIYIYMYIKLYVYVYILIYISQLYTRYLLSFIIIPK